ncbi:MAG: hypothetical protein MEBIL_02146 [Bilophila sp.]
MTYIPSLKNMSPKAVLRMAIAYSGKTNRQIQEEMGWSCSFSKKIFSSQEALPSFAQFPKLCTVLGNSILPQWVLQNMDMPMSKVTPMDPKALLEGMADMFDLMGNFAKTGHETVKDWNISPEEAWSLLKRLRDFFELESLMFAQLEEVLSSKKHIQKGLCYGKL